jgi:hypothetical protein
MSSGARCEEARPGTALGGMAISILTFYSGKGEAKFSEKPGPMPEIRSKTATKARSC